MKALEDIRADWRSRSFVWGAHDCILAACDYVRAVSGVDPAAPWRGSYRDEAGARVICDRYGGAWRLFRHGMARAGFEAGEVAPGAVVMARVGAAEVAGVFLGPDYSGRVAFVSERGLCEARVPVLEAWPMEGLK